ncbi:MAG: tellurium resistance protein TerA [Hymenobacter sp.]|nr:MAG: tellurium resistance protein TerA [Hymenobacter sp.]
MAITLQKRGDKHQINLSKEQKVQLKVDVNLNWSSGEVKSAGFLGKLFGGGGTATAAPDLDLGCMYELNDGSKGVIQPLGGNFGALNKPPYIFLDKDDRTGGAADGENMTIVRPDTIKRVMVFALIYAGAKDFRTVGGHMHFKISNGEEIRLALDNPGENQIFCAAALIQFTEGGIVMTKEERYFNGHSAADKHYGFGFKWTAGSK